MLSHTCTCTLYDVPLLRPLPVVYGSRQAHAVCVCVCVGCTAAAEGGGAEELPAPAVCRGGRPGPGRAGEGQPAAEGGGAAEGLGVPRITTGSEEDPGKVVLFASDHCVDVILIMSASSPMPDGPSHRPPADDLGASPLLLTSSQAK